MMGMDGWNSKVVVFVMAQLCLEALVWWRGFKIRFIFNNKGVNILLVLPDIFLNYAQLLNTVMYFKKKLQDAEGPLLTVYHND